MKCFPNLHVLHVCEQSEYRSVDLGTGPVTIRYLGYHDICLAYISSGFLDVSLRELLCDFGTV